MSTDYNLMKQRAVKAIDAVKECLEFGILYFKFITPQIAGLLAVAYVAKHYVSSTIPDEKDEMLKLLGQYKTGLDDLMTKMNNHFKDFKSFLTEHNYWNDVPLISCVMMEAMKDTLAFPGKDSEEEFKRLYEKNSPLELARRLRSQLEFTVTSPLKQHMNADPLMTTATLTTWEKLIESTFTQLYMIEIHAAGMFRADNTDKAKQVEGEVKGVMEDFKKWSDEYLKKSEYWPTKVQEYIQKVQTENTTKTIEEKAVIIRDGLETVHSENFFYVIVFPESIKTVQFLESSNQLVTSSDHGGCTVIVYRSLQAKNDNSLKELKEAVEKFPNLNASSREYPSRVNEEVVKKWAKDKFANCGLLLVIKNTHKVAVESTRNVEMKGGPGAVARRQMTFRAPLKSAPPKNDFTLIAAYK